MGQISDNRRNEVNLRITREISLEISKVSPTKKRCLVLQQTSPGTHIEMQHLPSAHGFPIVKNICQRAISEASNQSFQGKH